MRIVREDFLLQWKYINSYFQVHLWKNDIVSGTVYRINDEIGVFVAVEDRYFGLIPKNEYFKNYKIGEWNRRLE